MAPTAITVQQIYTPWATIGAGGIDIVFTALTETEGDTFVCTGREVILIKNGTGTNTLTIASEDDAFGRQEAITAYSLAEGDYASFGVGLTNEKGWKDSAGKIKLTPSSAQISCAVLRLPAGYGR